MISSVFNVAYVALFVAANTLSQVFLRRFRDPIRVPKIRENYHRVPKIRENRVPTDPYRVLNIFLKKKLS